MRREVFAVLKQLASDIETLRTSSMVNPNLCKILDT
jgi:hypothetical protein